tara:strand:+ start:548 stop:883 length:336 start_codon:yes stop_codon:yes gene_type:complete
MDIDLKRYLRDAKRLAKLDREHAEATAKLRDSVTCFEDAMKLEIKSHFDIDLSKKKGRVVLSKDFKVYPKHLGLAIDKNAFNFKYRQAVNGKISYVKDHYRKATFAVSLYS